MEENFTYYDIQPANFLNYLRYYGPHFNKKLCEFACKHLEKSIYSKEDVDRVLFNSNITLKNCKLHDYVYVANWCNSIFGGTSITNENLMALFLKDIFDKEGDLLFNRWYADMAKRGIPIEWEDFI